MNGAMQALIVAAAALGGMGVYLMMPRGPATNRNTGIALSAVALVLLWVIWFLSFSGTHFPARLLFCVLATMTVTGGVMTVTRTSPVSCALWFTSVVIGTAGLFLLQHAPFLAAAIVIVYAGAIVVMFLFVVMMAQQTGRAFYDRWTREPAWAILACFVLLLGLVSASVATYRGAPPAHAPIPGGAEVARTVFLDDSPESPQVASLGAALFTEHWVSLEVAGTILLVAMVSAIAIAARKQGT